MGPFLDFSIQGDLLYGRHGVRDSNRESWGTKQRDRSVHMRILVVTVSDVGRSHGEGITVLSAVRAFCRLNHSVTLLAPMPRNGKPVFRPGSAKILFTPSVRRLGLPNNLNTVPQLFAVLWLLASERPDLVYIRTSMLSPLIVVMARFLAGCRVVCEHNGLQWEERLAAKRFAGLSVIERWSQVLDARLAHRVRAVIPGIVDKLVERGAARNKFFIIGNAANVDLVVPLNRDEAVRRLGLDPDRRYIGFVGNFAHWQGLPTVIDALPALREQDPRVCCLLAGDGPLRESLQRDVKRRGLESHCSFLGEIAYQDLPTVLAAFDVALLPTELCIYASLGRSPLKLRDYAAAGCPVVAADVDVVRDLASEKWLKLYPVGDAKALAATVGEFLEDAAARRGLPCKARAYAERHFSWDMIGRLILEQSVLEHPVLEPRGKASRPASQGSTEVAGPGE